MLNKKVKPVDKYT